MLKNLDYYTFLALFIIHQAQKLDTLEKVIAKKI